jgi:sporulation protein YlmC with PRC-barrel domain
MELFVIRRRHGWRTPEELQAAAERSTQEGERRGDVRWIRSYVVAEDDGQLGTVCIYEAESEDAIRGHASDAGLPADEINKVADTVIVRPDPEKAATA